MEELHLTPALMGALIFFLVVLAAVCALVLIGLWKLGAWFVRSLLTPAGRKRLLVLSLVGAYFALTWRQWLSTPALLGGLALVGLIFVGSVLRTPLTLGDLMLFEYWRRKRSN